MNEGFRVPFEQASAQRLTDRSGRPYWIEIRRGNDPVTDWSLFDGMTQALQMIRWSVGRAAWAIGAARRSWRVVEFGSDSRGYQVFPPTRQRVVATREDAVALAEAWRDEHS